MIEKCECRLHSKSYCEFGLTDEEFLEIVDYFRELMRLDQNGKDLDKQRLRLTAVLRTRTHQLVNKKKLELENELRALEKFILFELRVLVWPGVLGKALQQNGGN